MAPTAAWTEVTDFPADGAGTYISGIAYGYGMYMAVGYSTGEGSPNGRVWTSADGVTWTARPDDDFAGLTLSAVTHNGVAFYAFASAPTTLWRSTDGSAWEQVDLPVAGGELGGGTVFDGASVTDAMNSSGRMFAAGDATVTGGDIACTCVATWWSDDGVNWMQSAVSLEDTFTTFAVLPNPGRVVVVTNGTYIGQAVSYSTDFDTWNSPPFTLAEGSGFLDAATDGTRIVLVGYAGDGYQEATALVTDGTTWTVTPIDLTAGAPAEQVTFDGGQFVAVGGAIGTNVPTWTSTDGVTWVRGADIVGVPPNNPSGEPGDDPFSHRTIGAGPQGVVLAQTFDDGLHVWLLH